MQFSGGSCVIAPDAEILASVDHGDGLALATIDPVHPGIGKVFGEKVFAQRRPALYMELMTNTFSWNPGDFFGLYGEKPLPAGRRARVAAGQFAPTGDAEVNLARIATLLDEAKASGAELLVLPERCLTGLGDPEASAVPLDGPVVSAFLDCVASRGLHVVAGLAERDGQALFNTAVVAGPEGLVGRYRQTHLTSADRAWATAGDDFAVFDLPFGRLGLLIGHDAAFPEAGRVLALRGCDVIACPAAIKARFHFGHAGTAVAQPAPIPTGADPLHWHHFRVRAGENNCYFAFANVEDAGAGYPGLSGVFGPDSFAFPRSETVMSGSSQTGVAGNSQLAVAEIDTSTLGGTYPTNVVRRKDLVLMRQPHHYRELIAR